MSKLNKDKYIRDFIRLNIKYDNYSLTEISKGILYLNLCNFTGDLKSVEFKLTQSIEKLTKSFLSWQKEIIVNDRLKYKQFLKETKYYEK